MKEQCAIIIVPSLTGGARSQVIRCTQMYRYHTSISTHSRRPRQQVVYLPPQRRQQADFFHLILTDFSRVKDWR